MKTKSETVAAAFGRHLDGDQFKRARELLSEDCRYRLRGRIIHGAKQVIETYRGNMEDGRTDYDELKWGESRVEPENASEAWIYFPDLITHGGLTHTFTCRQLIEIGEDGKIVQITHQDLPGELRRLHDFHKRCGLA